MRARLYGAIMVVLVGVSSGCASIAPVDYSGLRADDIAFQLNEGPGSPIPPSSVFWLPQLSVYGDGRVVRLVVDPTRPYRWPEPSQQTLTPVGMQRLLGAARDAGLAEDTDFGEVPNITDGNLTTFKLLGRKTEVGSARLVGTAPIARLRLQSFMGQVDDLDAWMGSEISAPAPYSYSKAAVYAREYDPQDPEHPVSATTPWPLTTSLGAGEEINGGTCSIIDAADLDPVKNTRTDTGYQQSWRSGDSAYFVTVRPLLPGETDCASVVG